MVDQSVHSCLLKAEQLSDSEIVAVMGNLVVKIDKLWKIASSLCIHLTGSTCKKGIMDSIVVMAQIGAVCDSPDKKII